MDSSNPVHKLIIDKTGPEVIKLEFILKLKIKHIDWLLADACPQTANLALYFEFENELKFYNLEAIVFRILNLIQDM